MAPEAKEQNFFDTTYTRANWASVFVPVKPFKPCLMKR